MDLLKLNMFRGGIFKQIRFLFSSPQKAQKVLFISEAGTISQELLPMHTGFVCAEEEKKAWLVLHNLKCQVMKNGEAVQDELVLPISERSYKPLDPFGLIKPNDKERLTSLTDIARLRHAEVRADTGKGKDEHVDLAQTIITGSFILLGLMLVIQLILRSCGGPG